MIVDRKIRKTLFQFEKTILFIMVMIFIGNILINGLVALFSNSISFDYVIEHLVTNLTMLSVIYLMTNAGNQVVTATPFLVSLNCPKKLLAKNIIIKGSIRGLIFTIIFVLTKVLLYRTDYWFISSIFGIDLLSSNIVNTLIMAGVIYVLLFSAYSLLTFISLLGARFNWQYVLSVIFIILGICFFLSKSIVLLVIFGWKLSTHFLIMLFFTVILNFINYKLIKDFEYKY